MAAYVISKDTSVAIDLVTFDFTGTKGQARPLDMNLVNSRVDDLKKNEPDECVVTKLWEEHAGACALPARTVSLQVPRKCGSVVASAPPASQVDPTLH